MAAPEQVPSAPPEEDVPGAGAETTAEPAAAPLLENMPFTGPSVYIMNYQLRPLNTHMDDDTLSRLTIFKTLYGTVFILVGVLAMISPVTFTFAIDLVIGSVLVVTGIAAVGSFFFLCGTPGSLLLLVLGVLHAVIGFFLLTRPAEAVVYLTLVLSAWFITQGVLKMGMAYSLRGVSSWPAYFLSGLLSVGLGFWIVALLPENSEWILGILFGVDVLVTGVAALLVALMTFLGRRRHPESEPLLSEETAAPLPA